MKQNIYVIFDSVAGEAGPLFTAKNDGVARRQYEIARDKNQFYEIDFMLMRVGVFDTESLVIEGRKSEAIGPKVELVEEIENESGI